jgi:2-polyprenyl-6-hydroxyphenyl methylase / 3-demethylubiquinone-9 3-methyltransferase
MEKTTRSKKLINNAFYDSLKEDWYTSNDHPIALLRAENKVRIPWVIQEIEQRFSHPVNILDVGCGAGFLTNALAEKGHDVKGIDLSATSLDVARQHDRTNSVDYLHGDAYALPFASESFDVVAAMDILEHVEDPRRLIQEASRVLRKKGIFFFHTFNRNWISYLLIIKGVDWFVRNAPKNMHVYSLFIKPEELRKICLSFSLQIYQQRGFIPDIQRLAFWKMGFTRRIPEDFSFKFTRSLLTGYCGFAVKE